MVSVADWMRANDTDCVDVYDSELDMGRAWGLPDPESPCFDGEDEVCGWIVESVEVVEEWETSVCADVWSFVERNLALFSEYAREWTYLTVDRTDDGVANGVMCAMFLMSGEAALDSYPWLAERIPEARA